MFAAQLPSQAIQLTSQSTDTVLYSGRCIFLGHSVSNAATTGGYARYRDGLDLNGAVIGHYGMSASSSSNVNAPGQGVLVEIGVFLDLSTVNLTGCIYVIPLWHYDFTPPGD